ncbi:MAG: 50S ribosomal protein L10 [Candidatus Gracilibacteria bacterium]|nr:50S ribosomal protein L10 [Candidatus Gracilibacteria bacterium]
MAVTKQQKSEIFNELVSKFKEAKSIGFSSTNKMTVEEFSDLRKSLREVNATYTLAKKTIMVKAIKEALNIDLEIANLEGQIGAICSNEDAVSGLGKVNAFMKEVNGKKGDAGKLAWSISIFEGEVKSVEETKVIASMPSRDTLLSRLVGSMMSPLSGMARFFDAAASEVEAQGKTKVGELTKKEVSAE